MEHSPLCSLILAVASKSVASFLLGIPSVSVCVAMPIANVILFRRLAGYADAYVILERLVVRVRAFSSLVALRYSSQ